MKEDGLAVVFMKNKRYSSSKWESSPEVPNLLNRDFHADALEKKLLTNITEFSIPAGNVYLSLLLLTVMMDGSAKPIVHLEMGYHYRWPEWIDIMNEAGFTKSMSRNG